MGKTVLVNCGHRSAGLAQDSLFYEWCYSCADENQRNDMRYLARITVVVSEADRAITTPSGGKLGTITELRYSPLQRRGSTRYRMRFVTAEDVHGGRWFGYSHTDSIIVHMRRKQGSK